jgi:hypothetical protein
MRVRSIERAKNSKRIILDCFWDEFSPKVKLHGAKLDGKIIIGFTSEPLKLSKKDMVLRVPKLQKILKVRFVVEKNPLTDSGRS